MIFIGIDPGVSGGIAVLSQKGQPLHLISMPVTETDLFVAMKEFSRLAPLTWTYAAIERVSASPQMGVVSAFTFGRGYGRLLMALTAVQARFDEITPRKWQAALGCLSGGDKNVTKRRAQQLFPTVKVTHAIADALLLAEYCRRLHQGLLSTTQGSAHGKAETKLPEVKWREATVEDVFAPNPLIDEAIAAGTTAPRRGRRSHPGDRERSRGVRERS